MATVKSFGGYLIAALMIPLALLTLMAMMPVSELLVQVSGVEISPWFTGGEVARTASHAGYETRIHRPIFDGLFSQRREGFIQVVWAKADVLPDIIVEDIDFDNDGQADFQVTLYPRQKVAAWQPYNEYALELQGPYAIGDGLGVRIQLANKEVIMKEATRRTGLAAGLPWLGAFAGIIIGAGLALFLYQQISLKRDQARFPAPGSLINVNDQPMHLNCTGRGEPVVVIDAGNANYSLDWANIQRTLEGETRVCTFDRPGYGWSSPAPTPRDAENVVEELRALLSAASIPAPYVLVGHSLGGLHVQLFAARYPREVAGLVLIDTVASLDPTEETRPERARQVQMQIGYYRFMRFMSGSGLLRVAGPWLGEGSLPKTVETLPEELREPYLTMMLNPVYYETAMAEVQAIPSGIGQLRQALGEQANLFGDLPLVVLSAGKIDLPTGSNPTQTQRVDVAPEEIAQQARLAARSSQGEHRLVTDSGHLIQLDQPDVVLTAIRDVIAAAKADSR
jgi:pimeloyl-ACP methyl ester carboxylesterase